MGRCVEYGVRHKQAIFFIAHIGFQKVVRLSAGIEQIFGYPK